MSDPTFTNYTIPAAQFTTISNTVSDDGTNTTYNVTETPFDSADGTITSVILNTDASNSQLVDVSYVTSTGETLSNVTQLGLTGHESSSAIAFSGADGKPDFVVSNVPVFANGETTAEVTVQDSGGTFVSCFAPGTMILTPEGDVPVESLKVGGYLLTSSGEARAIRWIGHRRYNCRFYPQVNDVYPVRIQAGAFGPNLPNRDLLVSPGHGMGVKVLDEVLIPASLLNNDSTIRQVQVDEVTYYHVELDTPDMLVANGLPAETYIDVGNRASFTTDAKVTDLSFSEAAPADIVWARPKIFGGPVVQAVKERLTARAMAAGWTLGSSLDGFHAVVDGKTLQPQMHDGKARFLIPASAKDVRLVAATSAPSAVEGSADPRRLGVAINGLTIDDALTARREIGMDDARLTKGFHGLEQEPNGRHFRWTTSQATLPASLWEGCVGEFFLQVSLLGGRPCWVAPAVQEAAVSPLQVVSGF